MSRCAWRTTTGASSVRGGRNADDDVPFVVDVRLERARRRPREHVLTSRGFLLRWSRDSRQLEEALPQERRARERESASLTVAA
jgi:hypothetical protein